MTDIGYKRISTKVCGHHGVDDCDCPSVEIKVPDNTYADLDLTAHLFEPPTPDNLTHGWELIDMDEYKARTGREWDE